MQALLNPWKEAATLILVAKTSNLQKIGSHMDSSTITTKIKDHQTSDQDHLSLSIDISDKSKIRLNKILELINKTDYRVMMVKRSGLSSFMASAYVFPGGAFENADFSSRWWGVFERANVSKNRVLEVVNRVKGQRPEIIRNSVTLNDYIEANPNETDLLPLDVALRVAAIRETFEETGVLLLANNENDKLIPLSDQDDVKVNLSNWREKVRNDANTFIELCIKLNKCPDIWSLCEWSNWLTPISVGHKRFDTLFYVCCLENIPKVIIDNREVTNLKWITPVEMLEEHTQERVFLAPPQVYELSRFYSIKNYNEFKEFIVKREAYGCTRWLPVISTYIDGAISALPGDEMYPQEPDLIGKKPVQDYPKKLKDLIKPDSILNRIELRGPTSVVLANIEATYGHLSPVSFYRNNEVFIQLNNSKL